MKLILNHIEMCTRNPTKIRQLLENQFRFQVVGFRETSKCSQTVLQSGHTVFIVTYRKVPLEDFDEPVLSNMFIHGEPWTNFCCHYGYGSVTTGSDQVPHVDSVFNVALCVENLTKTLENLSRVEYQLIQKPVRVDSDLQYAIVTSGCGNMIHTLIERKDDTNDWFLPGFTRTSKYESNEDVTTHLDHIAVCCRTGESSQVLEWYEKGFGMRRFLTNKNDHVTNGLVIDGDVGMRLKAMEFWKCSESGLTSVPFHDEKNGKVFKLVVAESLPNIKNKQIEDFLKDHKGPGLQHIGLHSSNIVKTVELMSGNGVQFRQPPPTYYTEVGQLEAVKAAGEDINMLRKYGILLDDEADPFDDDVHQENERYLMQIFTFPIFDKDTFFFEVIQRKGARGFGVGNVSALARSIVAYELQLQAKIEK